MTRNHLNGFLNSETCFCCMCKCGDHKCYQQLARRLPSWMQNDLKFDENSKKRSRKCASEADLYGKTTYKTDFCEQQDLVDIFPLEHRKPVENLKPFSKYGYATTDDSVYRNDFIPWSKDDQELCRAKLHEPDPLPKRSAEDGDIHEPYQKISDRYQSYYCPSHCTPGDPRLRLPDNCLMGHKDRFNLGPPAKRSHLMPEKPRQPFEKCTNYTLDYSGGDISSDFRDKPVPNVLDASKSSYPMSSQTSYRSAFANPPKIHGKPKRETQEDTLSFGDGPMPQESTSMSDFRDPDVRIHKPVRIPRETFQPPQCKMETTTTTGSTYKKWREYPRLERPNPEKRERSYRQNDRELLRSFTTYQEDYDGLKSALCPCRVAEKYGPKVLEPHYKYMESEKPHDVFRYNKDVAEPWSKACHH